MVFLVIVYSLVGPFFEEQHVNIYYNVLSFIIFIKQELE
jgi:hypothetical protein